MTPSNLDSNPPAWLATMVTNENIQLNARYQDAVGIYKRAIADWITANVQNRAAGLPYTAPPTPPVLTVIYPTVNPPFSTSQYSMPVDTTLPQAVLPPAAPTTPGTPILGPGGPNTGGTDPTVAAIYALLQKIAANMGIAS